MHSATPITLLTVLAACASSAPVRAPSNPILSDGADYTSDPAPLVKGGKLYLVMGRDTASEGVNDFEMPEWQLLETSTDPMRGGWTHLPHFLRPEQVFTWAAPGRAYAAQYFAYHAADAKNGGHFRRSVAIDRLEWDDGGKVRRAPLPPDMWATWSRANPPQQWILYQWEQPERLIGSSLHFWGDHPAGSGAGVAPPNAWRLEYWDGTGWRTVSASSPYTTTLDADNRVAFAPVTTRCLRAVFDASNDGVGFAAVALQEWEVYSTRARPPRRPSVKGAATANCS